MTKKLAYVLLGALLALFVVVTSTNIKLSNLPAKILTRHDNPEKNADFMIIMMGNVVERTEHAIKLYKQGYAKKIIFAEAEQLPITNAGYRWSDGKATYDLLTKKEIPPENIIFLSNTRHTNTKDELRTLLNYIPMHFPRTKRILLVTSWYHSARAHWVGSKYLADKSTLESFPTDTPEFFWKTERDFLSVYLEYLKWTYYLTIGATR